MSRGSHVYHCRAIQPRRRKRVPIEAVSRREAARTYAERFYGHKAWPQEDGGYAHPFSVLVEVDDDAAYWISLEVALRSNVDVVLKEPTLEKP